MSALINISSLNRAFKNVSVSNTTFAAQQTAYAANATAFANSFDDASLSDAALANLVLTNMGVLPSTEASVQALEPALAEYFTKHGNRGTVVMQLAELLSNLENATGSLAVYKSAAAAWNQEVVNAAAYSSNVANTVDSDKPAAGGTYTLTTGTDTFVGTAGNDTFTAAASDDTINATDFLVDNSSTDSDTLNITGKAFDTTVVSTGSIRGIEKVNVNFDSLSDSSFNAAGIDTASTITVAQTRVGSGAAVAVDNVLKGSTVVAGAAVNSLTATADADGDLTVTGADATTLVRGNVSGTGNVTVTADKAATVTAVSAKAATVTAAAATAVNATGATITTTTGTKDAAVVLTGVGTTDAATVKVAADTAVENKVTSATTIVETLNVAASAAAVVTLTGGAATTYNLSGAGNLTLAGDEALFDGKTIATTSTGSTTLKLTTVATSDLSKAGVNLVDAAAAAAAAAVLSLNNNASVKLSSDVNANGLTIDADDDAADTSTVYLKGTLNLELAKNITAGDLTIDGAGASDDGFDTVNLSVTAAQTSLNLLASTTTSIVATGSKALVLDATSTAKALNASAMTGAVTASTSSTTIADLKTGVGNDTITVGVTNKVVVDAGAGNDILNVGGALAATTTVAAGDGTDTLTLTANSDISPATVTGVDIVNMAGFTLTAKAATLSGSAAVIQASANTAVITLNDIGATVDLSNITFEHASNGTFSMNFSAGDRALSLGVSSNFTATGSSHADTITTGNGVNTVNGGAGGDSITGGSSIDTIDGGAGDDTIVGNDGADILTAGEGADVITGGVGNETIVLTETTAAVDKLVFSAAATNGKDTVTGFGAADTLNVAALGDGTIATVATAISTAAAQRTMTDNQAYVVTTDGTAASITTSGVKVVTDWTDATTVAAYLNEGFAAATAAATEANVFVINAKGTNMTYVWSYVNADVATDIDTAEITLVGVIDNGGTGLAAANVVFA